MTQTKYVFITGGVVSSLGKGLATAALGALLQAHGYSVRLRKLDPYLNVDPGTMSPTQHGEVFVTDDGAESDLDLGHYERFTGVHATKLDNITTGRVYTNVLAKERRGDYLGGTVQVIPHITDEIKDFIKAADGSADFCLCEIGGTVGDIEGLPFFEAARQFGNDLGHDRVMYLHVTLLPYIAVAGEYKTKPTQHSVKELLSLGIQPNMLLCRSGEPVGDDERRKIALFCNMKPENVISGTDAQSIYHVPIAYHQEGLDTQTLKYFAMLAKADLDLSRWQNIVQTQSNPEGDVTIAVVGKYTALLDSYKSLNEALTHGGLANKTKVHLRWMDSELFEKDFDPSILDDVHGILVPGGFGVRGTNGKINAIKFARERQVPFFGICFGMQLALIEQARHLCGLPQATSSEFGPSEHAIVGLMTEWVKGNELEQRTASTDLGGTMRLGAYECVFEKGARAAQIYGADTVQERHRHRYEVNLAYRAQLEAAGVVFAGLSPDGKLTEVIERHDHPWFVAVQYHPELKSKPFAPHPLFASFIEAAVKQSRLV